MEHARRLSTHIHNIFPLVSLIAYTLLALPQRNISELSVERESA